MSELKSCPFCGNEFPAITWFNSAFYWEIECPQCDIRFRLGAGAKERSKERIIDAWNRRVCANNARTENPQ